MLMKICQHCGKHYPAGTECECMKERRAQYQRRYDAESRDEKRTEFYHGKAWRMKRSDTKQKAKGLDELAWAEGRIEQGTVAHHIIPLEEAPNMALDSSNLIWISAHTHKNIHKAYKRSLGSKKAMQERLQRIISGRRGGG